MMALSKRHCSRCTREALEGLRYCRECKNSYMRAWRAKGVRVPRKTLHLIAAGVLPVATDPREAR